jgi:hypothetical protein
VVDADFMTVLPFRRRVHCVPGVQRWSVRVFWEDLNGDQRDVGGARFATGVVANRWAVAELERLRATKADQLGGPDCGCYVAAVWGPGRQPCHAYLFSDWEPVEWDCLDRPW